MYDKNKDDTETISSNIDFKWNVQQHISRISKLSSDITIDGGITNYSVAVKNLAMMLKSRQDKKYIDSLKNLESRKGTESKLITHHLKRNKNHSGELRMLELNCSLEHYGILIELLDRLNLLFETEGEDVIDKYG